MPVVPQLNDAQITAILTESLSRKMYETPDGSLPSNENQRKKDAEDLVQACLLASKNGNKSENVESILFIAQCDMKPEIKEDIKNVETNKTESTVDGLDLTQLSDGILDSLIVGLDKYPPTEQVEKDREIYLAEKARRAGESPEKIQEISQAEAPREANKGPGEISAEGSPAESTMDGKVIATEGDGSGSGEVSELSEPAGEDAGAFARAQTPETSKEGGKNEASKAQEDNRLKLESELTLPIVKAHKIDITKLSSLSISELEYIVANPGGPKKEEKMAIDESDVEATAVPTDKGGKSLGGITAPVAGPEVTVSKADLGLDLGESGNKTDDRENLESLITGPMLKAYGRGRKEIPSMGDNELRFMILNPDGKVDVSELEKAKALDQGKPEMVVTKEVLGPEVIDSFLSNDEPQDNQGDADQIVEANDRSIGQAAQESVGKTAIINVNVSGESREIPIAIKDDVVMTDELYLTDIKQASGQDRAMEIIKRENFPIPPDIDGDPPRLPNDVSKISRDELFSLHAGFHACESRINWVISGYEDELGDLEKLKRHREAVVAASVPFLGEDGKRNTNEYRDSQVNADKEVLNYGSKEHELKKLVNKLKVLQRNYHADCERMSRQMSKYERERTDAPR